MFIEHAIYAGTGGRNPRLTTIDPSTGLELTLTGLPALHSLYCMALSPDGEHLAGGTRSGRITLWSALAKGPAGMTMQMLRPNGPGILSLCFGDVYHVVVADISGQCCCWDLRCPDRSPLAFDAIGRTVCAIQPVGPGRLALLTTDGTLLLGDGEGGVLGRWEIVRPKTPWALVDLVAMGSPRRLVYAAQEGQLAWLDLDSGRWGCQSPRSGEVTAIVAVSDGVVTIGGDPGHWTHWRHWPPRPCQDGPSPSHIAMGALSDDQQVLAADADGRLWRVDRRASPSAVPLATTADGSPYRSLVSLGPQARQHYRDKVVRDLVQQAMAKDPVASGRALSSLEDLGRRSEAAAVALKRAHQRRDLPAALHALQRLLAVLGPDSPDRPEARRQYLAMLEHLWQYVALGDELRRSEDCGQDLAAWLQRVTARAQALAAPGALAMAKAPPDAILGATAAQGGTWQAPLVICMLRPMVVEHCTFGVDELVRAYTEVRQSTSFGGLVPAEVRPGPLIEAEGIVPSPWLAWPRAAHYGLGLRLAIDAGAMRVDLFIWYVPSPRDVSSVMSRMHPWRQQLQEAEASAGQEWVVQYRVALGQAFQRLLNEHQAAAALEDRPPAQPLTEDL